MSNLALLKEEELIENMTEEQYEEYMLEKAINNYYINYTRSILCYTWLQS